MTPEMAPMKRCGSCGMERRLHAADGDMVVCRDGGEYRPATINWAGFQRAQMERAEEIYDLSPDVHRETGLPVPFEDALPATRLRCIQTEAVARWSGTPQLRGRGSTP